MKEDRNKNSDVREIEDNSSLNRRDFLKRAGGGIFILFTVGDFSTLLQQRRRRGYPTDFNAYLRIGTDGRVSCFTGKIEMGQGVITSLAQMLADELDVGLKVVDMVMGDTDLCPWDMGTFGSMTTRFFGPPLRAAGAEARGVLLELASEHFQTSPEKLMVKEGVIYLKTNKEKSITYAQLAKGKKIERHLQEKAALKEFSEFKVMNKPVLHMDAEEKVTGKAKYAGDIRLPGMFYAKILRPPSHGATLKQVETSAAKKMKGVLVVEEGDFIAVLHKNPEEAEKALAAIKAEFDVPEPETDEKTIFEHLVKAAPEGNIVGEEGDLEKGRKEAPILFDETYLNSYVAHAPIEPHTATAKMEGSKVTVWASTQTPFPLKDEIVRTLKLSEENVRIITPFVGGGFGGKTRNIQGVEAARLAKITGKPVQVAWTRAEEFFMDSFRPAAVVKIKSGISNTGKIILWDYVVYFGGSRGSDNFYVIPNHKIVAKGEWMGGGAGAHPFAVGAWRAPANNTNTHARESQIDIMAAKAGIDPLEFRLNNLTDKRMTGVLKAAAEKFGYTPAKVPSRRGYGIACGIDAGTYVASIAEVEVDKNTGKIQAKRIVCAQDMGIVINPEGALIQMEGCITMGLGYALTEEIQFRGGNILNKNFDSYELSRFSWLPKIECVFVENNSLSPQGGGEPAIIIMGGVVANAVFDACGVRLYQLPMTPERVKEALKKI